jgi:uncharacterized membrane protein YeaQ/YmgE (transglycosylase-associated protein family)
MIDRAEIGQYDDMVLFVIILLIFGLIVGAIARLLVPGRDPIGLLGTIVVGILGSFVGGFLETLVQYHTLSVHQFHATGLIGSVIGAIVLLLILRLIGAEPGRRR